MTKITNFIASIFIVFSILLSSHLCPLVYAQWVDPNINWDEINVLAIETINNTPYAIQAAYDQDNLYLKISFASEIPPQKIALEKMAGQNYYALPDHLPHLPIFQMFVNNRTLTWQIEGAKKYSFSNGEKKSWLNYLLTIKENNQNLIQASLSRNTSYFTVTQKAYHLSIPFNELDIENFDSLIFQFINGWGNPDILQEFEYVPVKISSTDTIDTQGGLTKEAQDAFTQKLTQAINNNDKELFLTLLHPENIKLINAESQQYYDLYWLQISQHTIPEEATFFWQDIEGNFQFDHAEGMSQPVESTHYWSVDYDKSDNYGFSIRYQVAFDQGSWYLVIPHPNKQVLGELKEYWKELNEKKAHYEKLATDLPSNIKMKIIDYLKEKKLIEAIKFLEQELPNEPYETVINVVKTIQKQENLFW